MRRIIIRRSRKVENKILNKPKVINSLNFSIIERSLRKKMKLSTKYKIEIKKERKKKKEKLKTSKAPMVLNKSLK